MLSNTDRQRAAELRRQRTAGLQRHGTASPNRRRENAREEDDFTSFAKSMTNASFIDEPVSPSSGVTSKDYSPSSLAKTFVTQQSCEEEAGSQTSETTSPKAQAKEMFSTIENNQTPETKPAPSTPRKKEAGSPTSKRTSPNAQATPRFKKAASPTSASSRKERSQHAPSTPREEEAASPTLETTTPTEKKLNSFKLPPIIPRQPRPHRP